MEQRRYVTFIDFAASLAAHPSGHSNINEFLPYVLVSVLKKFAELLLVTVFASKLRHSGTDVVSQNGANFSNLGPEIGNGVAIFAASFALLILALRVGVHCGRLRTAAATFAQRGRGTAAQNASNSSTNGIATISVNDESSSLLRSSNIGRIDGSRPPPRVPLTARSSGVSGLMRKSVGIAVRYRSFLFQRITDCSVTVLLAFSGILNGLIVIAAADYGRCVEPGDTSTGWPIVKEDLACFSNDHHSLLHILGKVTAFSTVGLALARNAVDFTACALKLWRASSAKRTLQGRPCSATSLALYVAQVESRTQPVPEREQNNVEVVVLAGLLLRIDRSLRINSARIVSLFLMVVGFSSLILGLSGVIPVKVMLGVYLTSTIIGQSLGIALGAGPLKRWLGKLEVSSTRSPVATDNTSQPNGSNGDVHHSMAQLTDDAVFYKLAMGVLDDRMDTFRHFHLYGTLRGVDCMDHQQTACGLLCADAVSELVAPLSAFLRRRWIFAMCAKSCCFGCAPSTGQSPALITRIDQSIEEASTSIRASLEDQPDRWYTSCPASVAAPSERGVSASGRRANKSRATEGQSKRREQQRVPPAKLTSAAEVASPHITALSATLLPTADGPNGTDGQRWYTFDDDDDPHQDADTGIHNGRAEGHENDDDAGTVSWCGETVSGQGSMSRPSRRASVAHSYESFRSFASTDDEGDDHDGLIHPQGVDDEGHALVMEAAMAASPFKHEHAPHGLQVAPASPTRGAPGANGTSSVSLSDALADVLDNTAHGSVMTCHALVASGCFDLSHVALAL